MVTEITQYPARICFAANWQNYEILLILNHLQFISLIFTFRCFCLNCAHDKAFDFDKKGNWNGYMPTLLYGKNVPYEYLEGGNVIYWDLVDNPLCKQLDWDSWGLKRTAKDMVLFLEQYKDNKYAKYLIGNIKVDFIDNGLEDVELVLEAVET